MINEPISKIKSEYLVMDEDGCTDKKLVDTVNMLVDKVNELNAQMQHNTDIIPHKTTNGEMIEAMIATQEENEVGEVLDKIKDYINHIRNIGLGKKKSLEFIEKYINGLKTESENNYGKEKNFS